MGFCWVYKTISKSSVISTRIESYFVSYRFVNHEVSEAA
jgi:hypothetical protein